MNTVENNKKALLGVLALVLVILGGTAGIGYVGYRQDQARAAQAKAEGIAKSRTDLTQQLDKLKAVLAAYAAQQTYTLDVDAPVGQQVQAADAAFTRYLSTQGIDTSVDPGQADAQLKSDGLDKPYQMVQALKNGVVQPLHEVDTLNGNYQDAQSKVGEANEALAKYQPMMVACAQPFDKNQDGDLSLLEMSCTDMSKSEVVVLVMKERTYTHANHPIVGSLMVADMGMHPYAIQHWSAADHFETKEVYPTFAVVDPADYQTQKGARDAAQAKLGGIGDEIEAHRTSIQAAILATTGSGQAAKPKGKDKPIHIAQQKDTEPLFPPASVAPAPEFSNPTQDAPASAAPAQDGTGQADNGKIPGGEF